MINPFKLFSKPKITFECLIPEVAQIMPIVPAKEIKRQWVRRAVADLIGDKNNPTFGMERKTYTAKCPGIYNLHRQGWVLRTWQDITIETFGDGDEFQWTSALDQNKINPEVGDYVASHPKSQLHKYMDNWPANTLSCVIKIQTPWRCSVPKGYYLMEMPVPYIDDNRFTTLTGCFGSEHGHASLNVQMLWHVTKGKTLIKAGTPIAQYVLIPKRDFELEIKLLQEPSRARVQTFVMNNRFISSYGEVKRFYGEKK